MSAPSDWTDEETAEGTANASRQVYVWDTAGGARPLTDEPLGVLDYAPGPGGTQVVYSARQASGGADLWQVDVGGGQPRRLLDCAGDVCRSPAWAPDAARLAYERVNAGGEARVYLLDLQDGESLPLFEDANILGRSPRWAPDGTWLAFNDLQQNSVRLINLHDRSSFLFPGDWGQPGDWHPTRPLYTTTFVDWSTGSPQPHVALLDVTSGAWEDLSGAGTAVADEGARWSPDGERLALGRRQLADGSASLGLQLWLIDAGCIDERARAGGAPDPCLQQARLLTGDAAAGHHSYAWSPAGDVLAYVRVEVGDLRRAAPEVCLVETESGTTRRIDSGTAPAWLP